MKLHLLEATQKLPVPLSILWDFFANPANLAKLSPPSLGLEFTSELPERMYAGLLMTYRIRPFLGVALNWVNQITHVEEPYRFVDEQRFGPYRFFHHQHLFRPIEGGVEMRDLVHYAPPGGSAARRLLVGPRLAEIFAYRRHALERAFGAWTHD